MTAPRRFPFRGRRGWWFDVRASGIVFHRPYRANFVRFLDPR